MFVPIFVIFQLQRVVAYNLSVGFVHVAQLKTTRTTFELRVLHVEIIMTG